MTSRALSLDLTLPPSVNGLYATTGDGRRVKTRHYRTWRKQAMAEIAIQARGVKFAGTFRIEIAASDQGLVRDRDCDNLGKAIADALTKAGVIEDDCYRFMRSINLTWTPDLSRGTCRLVIAELSTLPISRPAKPARVHQRIGMPQISAQARLGVAEVKKRPPTGQRRVSGAVSLNSQAVPRKIPASIMR